ncbi:MAG: hypothetical protein FJZ01_21190 [Candidatus Sericytochromatia bacterium]|nr:hypothetical protein [Candidatus Tanganyikabacteria bacterium]
MRRTLAALLVSLGLAASHGMADGPDADPMLVDIGVWDLPLALSPSLEGRRDFIEEMLLSAQRRVRDFARRHKWHRQVAEPLAQRAAVYADKARFDLALIKLQGGKARKIPKTRVAALQGDALLLAAPEVYKDLAAEGIETDSYEKLMAHELAHGLHSRLLDGNDDLAGPEWFREGFAVYAANQYELLQEDPDLDLIHRTLAGTPAGHQVYGAVVRHFARRVPLADLVRRAYLPTFRSWLLQLETAQGQ